MRLLAVASAKASPGTSVATELIARLWPPGGRRLLVDCDPAGSAWLLRPGVRADLGLVTLAAAARRGLQAPMILDHLQALGPIEVLVGPAAARQAHAALESVGPELGARCRELNDEVELVVADCGRLHPGSLALPLCRAADRVLLACRPVAHEIVHVAPWVEDLRNYGRRVAILLVNAGPGGTDVQYGPDEVDDALGVPVVGTLAHDPKAVARLFADPMLEMSGDRSPLARSARQAAMTIAASEADAPSPAPNRGPASRTLATALRNGS